MKIAIIGTGYVGLVSGTCFSEMGVNVTCIDTQKEKIDKLKNGIIPIYEPGLEDMVHRNLKAGRLKFSTNIIDCLEDVEVIFSAVGTPPDEDGSADLHYVLDVAKTIGQHMNKYILVVTKSTVPVGTAQKVRKTIQEELDKRSSQIEFDVASNPEFLKEGSAINDFMKPDRVVVGIDTNKAKQIMERLYKPFMMNNYRLIFTDIPSAEMIKYAANSMLATRISFMNDIANLCEIVGANVEFVRKGVGSDNRIGSRFLFAGCGYGGSCFPKDVKALLHTGKENGYTMRVIEAVEQVNESQKSIVFNKLEKIFNKDLNGKIVTIWGLSFKPGTDDMREAPSLVVIDKLIRAGVKVKVYDPVAIDECKRRIGCVVEYSKDMYDAVIDADALLVLTEWKQFSFPSWKSIKRLMRGNLVVDGRNLYNRSELEEYYFFYVRIG